MASSLKSATSNTSLHSSVASKSVCRTKPPVVRETLTSKLRAERGNKLLYYKKLKENAEREKSGVNCTSNALEISSKITDKSCSFYLLNQTSKTPQSSLKSAVTNIKSTYSVTENFATYKPLVTNSKLSVSSKPSVTNVTSTQFASKCATSTPFCKKIPDVFKTPKLVSSKFPVNSSQYNPLISTSKVNVTSSSIKKLDHTNIGDNKKSGVFKTPKLTSTNKLKVNVTSSSVKKSNQTHIGDNKTSSVFKTGNSSQFNPPTTKPKVNITSNSVKKFDQSKIEVNKKTPNVSIAAQTGIKSSSNLRVKTPVINNVNSAKIPPKVQLNSGLKLDSSSSKTDIKGVNNSAKIPSKIQLNSGLNPASSSGKINIQGIKNSAKMSFSFATKPQANKNPDSVKNNLFSSGLNSTFSSGKMNNPGVKNVVIMSHSFATKSQANKNPDSTRINLPKPFVKSDSAVGLTEPNTSENKTVKPSQITAAKPFVSTNKNSLSVAQKSAAFIRDHKTLPSNPKATNKSVAGNKNAAISVRKSLTAMHLRGVKGQFRNVAITRTQSLADVSSEKILEESKYGSMNFKTPMAKRRSVAFETPVTLRKSQSSFSILSDLSVPSPQDLKERLSLWLKQKGKPLGSFHHLRCFGIHSSLPPANLPLAKEPTEKPESNLNAAQNTSRELNQSPLESDDENKENIEVFFDCFSPSYTDLRIIREESATNMNTSDKSTAEAQNDNLDSRKGVVRKLDYFTKPENEEVKFMTNCQKAVEIVKEITARKSTEDESSEIENPEYVTNQQKDELNEQEVQMMNGSEKAVETSKEISKAQEEESSEIENLEYFTNQQKDELNEQDVQMMNDSQKAVETSKDISKAQEEESSEIENLEYFTNQQKDELNDQEVEMMNDSQKAVETSKDISKAQEEESSEIENLEYFTNQQKDELNDQEVEMMNDSQKAVETSKEISKAQQEESSEIKNLEYFTNQQEDELNEQEVEMMNDSQKAVETSKEISKAQEEESSEIENLEYFTNQQKHELNEQEVQMMNGSEKVVETSKEISKAQEEESSEIENLEYFTNQQKHELNEQEIEMMNGLEKAVETSKVISITQKSSQDESSEIKNLEYVTNQLEDELIEKEVEMLNGCETSGVETGKEMKEDRKDIEDGNDFSLIVNDALYDLQLLIQEGYPRDQCEAWLQVIKSRFGAVEEEPQYWECRAALEEFRGDFTAAVHSYRTAIVKGAEMKNVDESVENLLNKFSLLNISPLTETTNIPKDRTTNSTRNTKVDVRNIFKSTIINFAVQERTQKNQKMKENMENSTKSSQAKFTATPVRKSTRLSRSGYVSTPGVTYCSSLNELDSPVRKSLHFKVNKALN